MRLPKIVNILLFEESRKVCFGVWLYATSTALLIMRLIDAQSWMLCMGAAAALVGGGTIADRYLRNKDNAPTAHPGQPQ